MAKNEIYLSGIRVEKILVRAVNWLGDAVMTTPALEAIRSTYPAAKITVLANPLVAQLLAQHPQIDEILIYDKKERHAGFSGRLRLAGELRRRRFDLAILLQNAIDAALLAWLARIPVRIGYGTDGRGLLLSHSCPVTAEVKAIHHVDYYLAMLEHFGISGSRRQLLLGLTDVERLAADRLLREAGFASDDFILGINPGAAFGSAKRWIPERFAAVADTLAERWNARVIITGGPGETEIASAIAAAMSKDCLNLAGKTDVRSLMALISRCGFFVTNDSGPMHIAAAFNVPVVAIFGSTDDSVTSPYSRFATVVRGYADCAPCHKRECPTDHRCMTAVTADQVVAAAVALRSCRESL